MNDGKSSLTLEMFSPERDKKKKTKTGRLGHINSAVVD